MANPCRLWSAALYRRQKCVELSFKTVKTGALLRRAAPDDLPTLDEVLATPDNWPSIAKRLRRIGRSFPGHVASLGEEAKKRDLGDLRTQLLRFPDALVAHGVTMMPHGMVALLALIATEGKVDDVEKKKVRLHEAFSVFGGSSLTVKRNDGLYLQWRWFFQLSFQRRIRFRTVSARNACRDGR